MDQEEILRKGRRFLDWSIQSSRNLRNVVLVLLGLGLLGFVLAIVVPTKVTSNATRSSIEAVQAAEQAKNAAITRFDAEIKWFTPEYGGEAPIFINAGTLKIQQATDLVTSAKSASNPDQMIRLLNKAESLCLESVYDFEQAHGVLDGIQIQRIHARQQLEQLESNLALGKEIGPLQNRLDEVKIFHLEVYITPIESELEQLWRNSDEISAYLLQGHSLLPADDSIERIGDPTRAFQLIEAAKMLIDESKNIATQITQELDYLDEAYTNAFGTAQSASHRCEESSVNISAIKADGYWLVTPSETLSMGVGFAENAITASMTQIEGTYDYPGIYKLGTDALYFCTKAQSDAETEVRTALEAAQLITSYAGVRASVETYVSAMHESEDILQTYHALSVWAAIKPNIEHVKIRLNNAEVGILYSQSMAAMDRQDFYKALTAVEETHAALADAQANAILVTTFANNQERFRQQWPNAHNNALMVINSQTTYIELYGAYDYSAQSDYDYAIQQLYDAENAASGAKYQLAVSLANEASEYASGTGTRALSSYNSHVAAQAAAEEARKRREQQQSSSSWDYDPWESSSGSGSSSGGSGSSSGGFNDPYDYDPGNFDSGGFDPPDYGSDFGSDSSIDFGSDSSIDIGSDSYWDD